MTHDFFFLSRTFTFLLPAPHIHPTPLCVGGSAIGLPPGRRPTLHPPKRSPHVPPRAPVSAHSAACPTGPSDPRGEGGGSINDAHAYPPPPGELAPQAKVLCYLFAILTPTGSFPPLFFFIYVPPSSPGGAGPPSGIGPITFPRPQHAITAPLELAPQPRHVILNPRFFFIYVSLRQCSNMPSWLGPTSPPRGGPTWQFFFGGPNMPSSPVPTSDAGPNNQCNVMVAPTRFAPPLPLPLGAVRPPITF